MTLKSSAKPVSGSPLRVELELAVTEAAFERVEARLLAMSPAEVRDARIDLTVAAEVAIAGAKNLLARRELVESMFRDAPIARVEGIEELAHAAQHAELMHRAAQDIGANFADVLPRVNELRAGLLLDLAAQVRRKRAPERLLEDVRGGDNSLRDKANDLNDMAGWYREHWSEVEGRSTVERGEVDEASELATRVLARLGALMSAQRASEGALGTEEMRRRAFTALWQDYEEVRRYGCFVFWSEPEGWNAYIPSLWAGRSE